MKNRKKGKLSTNQQKNGFKWARLPLFLAVFAVCVSAAALGGLLPTDAFHAFAQLRTGDKSKTDDQNNPRQDNNDWISDSARQQIAGLVQEKLTRSAGRKKMDSRLI